MNQNRRNFLKAMAAVGGALALPKVEIAEAFTTSSFEAAVEEAVEARAGLISSMTLTLHNDYVDTRYLGQVATRHLAQQAIALEIVTILGRGEVPPQHGEILTAKWFRDHGADELMKKSFSRWPDEWEFRVWRSSIDSKSPMCVIIAEMIEEDVREARHEIESIA